MALYLLVKEHNITGLKYLCKHESQSFDDCVKYRGSGVYWRRHIKQNDNNVTTRCLFVTEDKDIFKKVAKEYSIKFDVVNSKEWANLTIEEGQGGNTVVDKKEHGIKTKLGHNRPGVREKMLTHLNEHIKNIQPLAAQAAKVKLTGVPKSEKHKKNMMGIRPHVVQSGNKNNNAKKIQTPFGIFGSIRDASVQIKDYTYRMIHTRLNDELNSDWRYI